MSQVVKTSRKRLDKFLAVSNISCRIDHLGFIEDCHCLYTSFTILLICYLNYLYRSDGFCTLSFTAYSTSMPENSSSNFKFSRSSLRTSISKSVHQSIPMKYYSDLWKIAPDPWTSPIHNALRRASPHYLKPVRNAFSSCDLIRFCKTVC